MANDEIDELDALSNPELVKQAELEGSRPKNAPKFLDIICDIAQRPLEKYTVEGDYGEYEAINLHLTGIQVNRCVEGEMFTDDEFDLEIRVPKKANSNSPLTLMVASSIKVDKALASIRNWPGLKKAHLVEKVHTWTMNEKAKDELGEDLKDDNGKQVYISRQVPTRYYALVGLGSKGGGTATVKPPEPKMEITPEVQEVAIKIIRAQENGMSQSDFNKAAMKDTVLKGYTDALMDGSLLDSIVANGAVVNDNGNYVVVS